jgi:hypothetical protein
MADTVKNIVTNILAFIFWGLAIYEYFTDKSMYFIVSFILIGLLLFVFKNVETKKFLTKFIDNLISKKTF